MAIRTNRLNTLPTGRRVMGANAQTLVVFPRRHGLRLPPEVFEQLKCQKQAVLTLLEGKCAGLPTDQAASLQSARQFIAGEFDGGHRSLLESPLIGVRGIKHPPCVEARGCLDSMLGKVR